jgi:hypothetical protein
MIKQALGRQSMKKIILIASILLMTMCLSAEGAGGLFSSSQTEDLDWMIDDFDLSYGATGLESFGGFGYGVGEDGDIVGGFGIVFENQDSETQVFGAFGGIINGYKVISSPINLVVASWTGVGVYDMTEALNNSSGIGLFEELSLEIGLPVTGWFMPSVYAGYQWILPLTGRDIFNPVSASPVVGVRLQWGAFE